MFYSLVALLGVFILAIINQTKAGIVPACRVQNVLIQPTHGTSLKTKRLVSIVQLPPVFVQNVMIGICENAEQNGSFGRNGEYFTCHQRYSTVEVYIAQNPPNDDMDTGSSGLENPTNYPNIEFARESVIIESGCDFSLNLLNLFGNRVNPEDVNAPPPKENMLLRSPFHGMPSPQLRQPPGSFSSLPMPSKPQPPFQGNLLEAPVSSAAQHQSASGYFMEQQPDQMRYDSPVENDYQHTVTYNTPITIHTIPDSASHPSGMPGGGEMHHVMTPTNYNQANHGRATSELEDEQDTIQ